MYLHSSFASYVVFKYKILVVYSVVQWLYKQIWKLEGQTTDKEFLIKLI